MKFLPAELIKRKRNGATLSQDEISFFIKAFTDGSIPDYQMSALLMAIYFQGMTKEETAFLTESVLISGTVLDLSSIPGFKVDKHSTGGVGDKTSLILGPLVASLGLHVPMISGRGLGHTGGTLDKLESIPGFNINLSLDQFVQLVRNIHICFIGQTAEICPADKKMYALRDVTATVESFPLITASIMSKKLAEGIDGLALDVKVGTGAFMKTTEKAEALALSLMGVAHSYGKKVTAVLSNMDQPLGRFAGNSLETQECIDIMRGLAKKGYEETRELSLVLSAHMVLLAQKAKNFEEAYKLCEENLKSGQAYEKFEEMCRNQGGDLTSLPCARHKIDLIADRSGFISSFDTEKVGLVGIMLGAGRKTISDVLDFTAGIEFHSKIGDKIEKGDVLFSLYGNDENRMKEAAAALMKTVTISLQNVPRPSLILKTLR